MKGHRYLRGQSCATETGEWHPGEFLTWVTCMLSTIDIVLTMLLTAILAQQQPPGPARDVGSIRDVLLPLCGPHRGFPLSAPVLALGPTVHPRNLLNVVTSGMHNSRCATLETLHEPPYTTPLLACTQTALCTHTD